MNPNGPPWVIPIGVLIASVIIAVVLAYVIFPPVDSTPHTAIEMVQARVVDKFFDESMYGGYKILLPGHLYSSSGEVYNFVEVNKSYLFTIRRVNISMSMMGNINSTKITSASEVL